MFPDFPVLELALLSSNLSNQISVPCFSFLLQENIDALIRCMPENLGFSEGKPVAAFTIYKCLVHWKSFEAERTSVFDRLIQIIGSEIEVPFLKISETSYANACSNFIVHCLFTMKQKLSAAFCKFYSTPGCSIQDKDEYCLLRKGRLFNKIFVMLK